MKLGLVYVMKGQLNPFVQAFLTFQPQLVPQHLMLTQKHHHMMQQIFHGAEYQCHILLHLSWY